MRILILATALVIQLVATIWPALAFVPKPQQPPPTSSTEITVRDESGAVQQDADIYVNGTLAGKTSSVGKFTFPGKLDIGTEVFAVYRFLGGSLQINENNISNNFTIDVTGEGWTKFLPLEITGVRNGLLPSGFGPALIVRPLGPTGPIGMTDLQNVIIFGLTPGNDTPNSYGPNWLSKSTVLGDGSVRITIDSELRSYLDTISQQSITVSINGLGKAPYFIESQSTFLIGRYQVNGTIIAPPSRPNLKVNNLSVRANALGTNITYTAVTDVNGRFSFTQVPFGLISIEAKTVESGLGYSASGDIQVSGNTNVTLTALGFADVVNGVSGIQTGGASQFRRAVDPERQKLNDATSQKTLRIAAAPSGTQTCPETSKGTSTSAGAENAPITRTAQITVPKGKKTVKLRYNVSSVEYPTYVLANSRYNDVWSITVSTPNNPSLYKIVRRVNSQVSQDPRWLSNGSTGNVEQEIDVSNLTLEKELPMVLAVSSTNIGDSALTTSVSASVVIPQTNVSILVGLSADNNPINVFSLPVNPAPHGGTRLDTGKNDFARTLTLSFSGISSDEARSSLKVYLDGINADNVPIVDTGATPSAFTKINDAIGRVLVTATGPISKYPISISPQNFSNTFRYRVVYENKGPPSCTLEFKSPTAVALYRMPEWSASKRYPARDKGGDDWSSPSMYRWLQSRRDGALNLVVNDVSGEHGRNIGHTTHQAGLDVDLLQFYRSSTVTGGANYQGVENSAVLAVSAKTAPERDAAKQRLIGYITAQRNGLKLLDSDAEVILIYAGTGAPASSNGTSILAGGWLKDLITKGTTPTSKGAISVGGTATFNKVQFRSDHNDHNHARVRAAK